MNSTINIFVSYSHQDSRYLERDSLLGFLKGLERDNIRFWTDQELKAGELWDQVIKQQLQACDIALVLVSQGFLDSAYCRNVEIAHLLAGTKHLFPVILSPCDWKRHAWLASRQFLPGGEQTVEEHFSEAGARKRLFLKIREQLLERAELIRTSVPNLPDNPLATASYPGQFNFSGKIKIDFCQRLGADWKMLADYLELPPAEQNRFPMGDESRSIWVWLENRRRLQELPNALNAVDRPDLAALFTLN
jgi:hypothetical protein